jgi:hypothetical protein
MSNRTVVTELPNAAASNPLSLALATSMPLLLSPVTVLASPARGGEVVARDAMVSGILADAAARVFRSG